VSELTDEDHYMVKVLLALRGLADTQRDALDAFDNLIENADPGFDPDPVTEFDERTIAMEHLAAIRMHVDGLVRLLAATKGRHALGELVARFEAAEAEREQLERNEPLLCVRCGVVLATPQAGGSFSMDSMGAYCPDEVACGYRSGRRMAPGS
jgi:hypothetical protein